MMFSFCFKFCGSVIVLSISVLIGVLHHLGKHPRGISIQLYKENRLFEPRSLTEQEVADYQRDGTVLVRNLLSLDQIAKLKQSAAQEQHSLTILDLMGTRFYNKILFDMWRTDETVANLALVSLPQIATQVVNDDNELRLLRDAYFSYAFGGEGCGWHVDDEGFWPTHNDTSGVTIWIALDDMSKGGGLAVANSTLLGSDKLAECRRAIQGKTCLMETLAPDCHAAMEEAKITMDDVGPGDAILWDRWVFHRTVPVLDTTADDAIKQRYSVRYMPSHSRAYGAVHPTVPSGSFFVGSPYYPQVWPRLIDAEVQALEDGGLDCDVSPINILRTLTGLAIQKARALVGFL